MKRIVALAVIISVLMTGCASTDTLQQEINDLQEEKSLLLQEIEDLEELEESVKEEKGIATYIVTFNLKQSHITLDLGQHLKDAMNEANFDVGVSKEYYDSVEVGTVINDDFRMGSLILKGSFGSWNVTVSDKRME